MKLILKVITIVFLAINSLPLNSGQDDLLYQIENQTHSVDEGSLNEFEYTDDLQGPSSIVDRWRQLYEQGKNIPIRKNVEHINQTFETLKTFEENMKYPIQSNE